MLGLHHPEDPAVPPWGAQLLEASYEAARVRDYLFHDFGDTHLILP
jgi:S-adenosylmethionine:tRNA-ribosyltransferase-isomerase (queuine synthetase)